MVKRVKSFIGDMGPMVLLLVSLAVPLNLKVLGLLTVYTFDIALFVLYAVWLWELAREARPLPRLRVLDIAALIMLGWFVLCAALGTNPLASFDAVLFYVRMYLIYLYVANNLRTATQSRNFVGLLLALIAIEGIVCAIQYVTKTNFGAIPDLVGATVRKVRIAPGQELGLAGLLYRARGTLGFDTHLGGWFVLLLPVAVSLWATNRKRSEQIVYGGVVALGLAGLVLTFARGAWMGVAVAMAVLFLMLARRMGLSRQYLIALGLAASILGLLLLAFWTPIQARLFSEKALAGSVHVRTLLNRGAITMISDRPVAGVGPGNSSEVASQMDGLRYTIKGNLWIKVDNVYLLMASETGLVGLELFLAFLAVAGVSFYHVETGASSFGASVGRGLLAGLVGVLSHAMIDWGFVGYMVFPLFWTLLGLGSSLRQLRDAT